VLDLPGGGRRALPQFRVIFLGDVAQLEEHLLCKQGVVGSSPIISTIDAIFAAQMD
jgi:hypothetical protein